jgi:hypothetical protein
MAEGEPKEKTPERVWDEAGYFWEISSALRMHHESIVGPKEDRLRLFVCGCCRRVWPALTGRAKRSVEAAEKFSRGEIGLKELEKAHTSAYADAHVLANSVAYDVSATHYFSDVHPLHRIIDEVNVTLDVNFLNSGDSNQREEDHAYGLHLMREMIANPFHHFEMKPEWLAANNGAVANIAYDILEKGEFEHMPYLADALEEAGCTDVAVLDHLRGSDSHNHDCWALHLIFTQGNRGKINKIGGEVVAWAKKQDEK